MALTRRAKKWLLAGATALTGAMADIGAQLASGFLVNLPRAVLVGFVIGAVCRTVGAVLAAIATSATSEAENSPLGSEADDGRPG